MNYRHAKPTVGFIIPILLIDNCSAQHPQKPFDFAIFINPNLLNWFSKCQIWLYDEGGGVETLFGKTPFEHNCFSHGPFYQGVFAFWELPVTITWNIGTTQHSLCFAILANIKTPVNVQLAGIYVQTQACFVQSIIHIHSTQYSFCTSRKFLRVWKDFSVWKIFQTKKLSKKFPDNLVSFPTVCKVSNCRNISGQSGRILDILESFPTFEKVFGHIQFNSLYRFLYSFVRENKSSLCAK